MRVASCVLMLALGCAGAGSDRRAEPVEPNDPVKGAPSSVTAGPDTGCSEKSADHGVTCAIVGAAVGAGGEQKADPSPPGRRQ